MVDEFLRKYLFTSLERKMVRSYLKNGHKEENFNALLSLIRRNHGNLANDFELLTKVSKKAGPAREKKSNSRSRKK